ncbi:MAG: hypothetical protein JXJ17_19720 [Anaerolineae bacterium]|nr:hypothetical protein [Anaerolineae bacterium]
MLSILFGIFIILHGLVHLLYGGQSAGLFELQEGLTWPDGSWAFAKLLGNEATRMLTNVSLVLAAAGFATGGIGILLKQSWSRPVIAGAAIFSSVIYILMWDGVAQKLHDKGGIGILINLAILAVLLILHWPNLG